MIVKINDDHDDEDGHWSRDLIGETGTGRQFINCLAWARNSAHDELITALRFSIETARHLDRSMATMATTTKTRSLGDAPAEVVDIFTGPDRPDPFGPT